MRFKDLKLPTRSNPLFNSLADFSLQQEIGDGGFSVVYLATHTATQHKYAIKRIDLAKLYSFNKDNIEKEVEAHLKLNHPHVVKLFDFFGEDRILYMVLEVCNNGNLFNYVIKQGLLSLPLIKRVFLQTINAIDYVHKAGYIIRDLKPENILLDQNLNVKLCDFGWCVGLHEHSFRKTRAGTYAYMSPESLNGELQDEKTDIWSLGIFLYELFVGKEPYTADNFKD